MFRKDRIISEDQPEHGGVFFVYVLDRIINCHWKYDLEWGRVECVSRKFAYKK